MGRHSKILRKGYTVFKLLRNGGVKILFHEISHRKEIKLLKSEQKFIENDCNIDSDYENNIDFSARKTDVKMLAFYLPQFHTFSENDECWGEGFTEWINVRKGDSRFEGHYQPRVPHPDFGYYDLSELESLKKQVELAKQHGIYGFCFYYYWFSGKRLMEELVDMLMQHSEIIFPFCLCWVNENWTRVCGGQNKEVLMTQNYSDADDPQFILDIKKYMMDSRYIRINGKPLIVVYNPGEIPNCHKSFDVWRKIARENEIGEILIWTCQTSNNSAAELKIEDCIDAEIEFPPHNMRFHSIAITDVDLGGKSAFLYNYNKLVDLLLEKMKFEKTKRIPLHHSCMMAWDNAARRKDSWITYCGFSLKSLYKWVVAIAEKAREDFCEEERYAFINAWNKWEEGTYLEPDEKYGYANINTVARALMGLPLKDDLKIVGLKYPEISVENFRKGAEVRIAVQVHMFYLETLDETIHNLNCIPFPFDCYISTDSLTKCKRVEEEFKLRCKANKICVEVFDNRGRDVAPFLVQMKDRIEKYEYICHIHSKKTRTNDHGNEWRRYIFDHLFGSEEYLKRVFYIFESNPNIGIIMPETYPVLELQAVWGGNRTGVNSLLSDLGIEMDLPKTPVFPVGNMFWARVDAVKRMFQYGFAQEDFPKESGQVNATIAHQIERAWIYLIRSGGYSYQKVFNNCEVNEKVMKNKKRIMVYAHYDVDDIISEEDIKTLEIFTPLCNKIIFVTNSVLKEEDIRRVKEITNSVIARKNEGFHFGAWKMCLLNYGKEKICEYDELILLNNSCFPPVFDIKKMFADMENRNLDFWGNTVFPYLSDGSFLNKDHIDEYVQSYFMVFQKNVLESNEFWQFWYDLPECKEFEKNISEIELALTKKLSEAGFQYEPYIKETYYISRFLNNYAVPYEKPSSLLLLKDPFMKKKCYQYMDAVEKTRVEYILDHLRE